MFRLYGRSIDPMTSEQPKNPLHGYTLEQIVVSLSDYYGWEGLGGRIEVRCFNDDPSVKSSLKFLRKTPWARKKVEELFVYTLRKYGTEEATTDSPGDEVQSSE